VTGSRSRAWLCFKATEEGEEEDGLFEDRRAGDQILWKGGLSLSLSHAFQSQQVLSTLLQPGFSHRSYHVMV
jgi:hypothetical protein